MTLNKMVKTNDKVATRPETGDNQTVHVPAVDILESEDAFRILADMPGVDENSVEVDLDRNTLTLRGRRTVTEPEGHNLACREYRSGNYERVFTLGNSIDRDGVEARVKNGVLELRLPKAKELRARKIPVSAA